MPILETLAIDEIIEVSQLANSAEIAASAQQEVIEAPRSTMLQAPGRVWSRREVWWPLCRWMSHRSLNRTFLARELGDQSIDERAGVRRRIEPRRLHAGRSPLPGVMESSRSSLLTGRRPQERRVLTAADLYLRPCTTPACSVQRN